VVFRGQRKRRKATVLISGGKSAIQRWKSKGAQKSVKGKRRRNAPRGGISTKKRRKPVCREAGENRRPIGGGILEREEHPLAKASKEPLLATIEKKKKGGARRGLTEEFRGKRDCSKSQESRKWASRLKKGEKSTQSDCSGKRGKEAVFITSLNWGKGKEVRVRWADERNDEVARKLAQGRKKACRQ